METKERESKNLYVGTIITKNILKTIDHAFIFIYTFHSTSISLEYYVLG